MKKKQIRIGMEVCSIYEPGRKFKIDRSLKGQRLYHEKGSTRWYTKRELLAFKTRDKGIKALTAVALQKASTERSIAIQMADGGLSPKTKPTFSRTCPECGKEFRTENKKAKFCSDACRSMNWKWRNEKPVATA